MNESSNDRPEHGTQADPDFNPDAQPDANPDAQPGASSAPDPADLPDLNVSVDGDITDHRRPLLRAAKLGGAGIAVLTVVSLMVWGGTRGAEGLWGVLIGAAIGGGFVLATVGVVLLTADSTPTNTLVVVFGTWLIKILVVLVVLAVLRRFDFYDSTALGVTTILALVVGLATETLGVLRTRTTYVG